MSQGVHSLVVVAGVPVFLTNLLSQTSLSPPPPHHSSTFPMLDTVDLKRDLDQLTERLGKTQEYL
jgi:hypothetical protein